MGQVSTQSVCGHESGNIWGWAYGAACICVSIGREGVGWSWQAASVAVWAGGE